MKKFNISITGYGAELTIGTISEELKQKIIDSGKDISEVVFDDELIGTHWAEIDNIYHNFNVGDSFTITITDENDEELYSFTDEDVLYNEESSIEIEYQDKYFSEDEPCIVCCSQEKGEFFLGTIEADEFDVSKLKLVIDESAGLHNTFIYGDMIGKIFYDGEELDNYGGSTDGKSFDVAKNF